MKTYELLAFIGSLNQHRMNDKTTLISKWQNKTWFGMAQGNCRTVLPDALYDCPICSQEFEQVSSLKDHVYEHRENGIFTCPHCEKIFKEYPSIRKHIKAFHSEKRFACTNCEKSFIWQVMK